MSGSNYSFLHIRAYTIGFTLLLGVAYAALSLSTLDVRWTRIWEGSERALQLFSAFLYPQIGGRWEEIIQGLFESFVMTITATAAGILLSIPLALASAQNLSPLPLYTAARALISLSRALHELVLAIFFVAVFGFGPFAGFLTLTIASLGFFAKLLAEEIENINRSPLEALKSSGVHWSTGWLYALLPQIAPRFTGLTLYRIDINFRESAIIGIVGAGGIGATLNTALDRYEYSTASAILLIIIGLVLSLEYLSSYVRSKML